MFKPSFNKETKIWSGPKIAPIYNSNQNLGQLIVRVLEQTPNFVTQISADTGVEVTCGEMRNRILKIAEYYNEIGLKQGDIVGVVARNTENLAPAVFACFLNGLTVNPVSPYMVEKDIIRMYSKTNPKLILCDELNLKIVQNVVDEMKSDAKIHTVMETVDGYMSVTQVIKSRKIAENLNSQYCESDSIAMIVYSSGSTSAPKAISKSHKEIINTFTPLWSYNSEVPNILYQFTAIFWFTGFLYLVTATLFKCIRVITAEKATPEIAVGIINKYRVTSIITMPNFVASVLELKNLKPLESIKQWMVGGQPIPKILCEKFKNFLPNGMICGGYGCTEMGSLAINSEGNKYGSSGYLFENVEMKIVDENGNALDKNQKGEIYIRSISEFNQYLNDPEATNKSFDGEWFKTGDIGYFDNDGCIYVIDRKKEILKLSNYCQVIPAEIEAIINEIKGVTNSSVVGVIDKNIGIDVIHAFVITDKENELTEEYVKNYVNERVISDKQLRGCIYFVESFPLLATGKVDRINLKSIAKIMLSK